MAAATVVAAAHMDTAVGTATAAAQRSFTPSRRFKPLRLLLRPQSLPAMAAAATVVATVVVMDAAATTIAAATTTAAVVTTAVDVASTKTKAGSAAAKRLTSINPYRPDSPLRRPADSVS